MKAKIIFSLISLILILGSSGTAFYFYNKYQEVNAALQNPEAAAQNETKSVTDKLSKLMVLPIDEEPSVATVMEKDKIKDQPFFQNAQNGDKVVIYSKAQKAILFRISENRIIEVAPISITQPEATPSIETVTPKATPTPSATPTVTPAE